MQRMTASSGSRTVLLPQTGQVSGIWYGTGFSPWRTTFKTSGIISPAFRTSRVSPIQIPFSVIKSWLCRVARLTEVPARVTLSKTAVGVRAPVRPTWISISRRTVSFSSGGYLKATAQRGNLTVEPICSRRARSLILTTAPSISKSFSPLRASIERISSTTCWKSVKTG